MPVEALNGFTSTKSIFRFAQSERNQREAGEVFILQVEKALKRHLITLMRSEGKLVWASRKSKLKRKEGRRYRTKEVIRENTQK